MDISAPLEIFLSRHRDLPEELQHVIQDSHINLQSLALAALNPRWSTTLFVHLDVIFADVCARWSHLDTYPQTLAAFGRIIPFAPHLVEYAELFLRRNTKTTANIWKSVSGDDLVEVFLAIFRLLVADCGTFKKYFDIKALFLGLQHESRPVRYLTVRVMSLYFQAADYAEKSLIQKYLSSDEVEGPWEDKVIDYTFLSLWEEKRWKDVSREQKLVKDSLRSLSVPKRQISVRAEDLSPLTVLISGTLMPRLSRAPSSPSNQSWIPVPTTISNVQRLNDALIRDRPVLLTGLAGSGKTSIINFCAEKLNKHESMVTLHLNEQSDAKMLIGMYTTGTEPGTFVWQPGVLTTAVRDGRWLIIEDIDQTPNEIISVLLPLIERKEILIPSRGETVKAAPGFKIIATIRTTRDLGGNECLPKRHMIGSHLWDRVVVDVLPDDELKEVIVGRYASLRPHAEQIMAVYVALQEISRDHRFEALVKTGSARPLTPRALFKWCKRLSRHFSPHSEFSDKLLDDMFLEAMHCFTGHLPAGELLSTFANVIAEKLHIDAGRRDHLLQSRVIKLLATAKGVSIGRIILRQSHNLQVDRRSKVFAHSPYSLRVLEKLAVAVENREPTLLVGETGIGKTTCIQHLATLLGQKLVSFNMSQQSESGDLLGGFKPVNVRGLIMPLREEFDELFSHPLSPFAKRKDDNRHFLDMLGKALAKAQWKKVCLMWRSAATEILKSFDGNKHVVPTRSSDSYHPSKRRRTTDTNDNPDQGLHALYQARWRKFAAEVKNVEGHLVSKPNAFAFKFIEGSLVRAVRNGNWVLLDEINLASPDTLEMLVDLLGGSSDQKPSLLLSESGNIERITAHPDFRIFAAMNPATDIGKKDLPPGIRSRFTEFFIDSPDKDVKSLQHIVSSYLPSELGNRIVSDVTNLYMDIQKLAEANSLVDGAGQKPHFSLRTLTRTLVYARDVAAPVGIKDVVYRRALYEGFHMSFLTLLDTVSEALVAPKITHHLFSQHTNAKAELSRPLPRPTDGRAYVQEGHYWLQRGPFESQKQPHYIITPFVQRNLNNLIRAISTKKLPILIQGPTSSGKTSMVEYLAKKSGNKFVRINNHEHTDLQEYLGTYISDVDGQLKFQEGVLVEALRKGYWIVLDELNLAPTDVLEALNRLLDDNRELLIPETQEVVTPHPDFMLFATQNPAGLYGGRKHLSRAFRNRFLELHFDDIPVNELCEILQQRTQIPPSWAQRIVDTYKELSSLRQENRMFEQKSFATLRDLFRWALRKADDKQQLAVNGYMLLGERVRKPEEREKVKTIIEQVMSREGPKVKIDVNVLYSDASSPDIKFYESQVNGGSGGNNVVWTSSMRRLYVLVANAVRNNEPVLLVGETGCGKTTVCQMLADALGKELFVVNAHQNTETGDLIGSQRPIRNRAAIEAKLQQLLRDVLPNVSSRASLSQLWSDFETYLAHEKSALPNTVIEEIQTLRARSQALFEWTDGSLVHAMKKGQLFLLDEISLADDSVLERLNSVLEPSRTLLLAEKGSTSDVSVTAIEGFQFLATMNPGGDYGKRELSPALRNRFTEIWVPSLYDYNDILQIVRAKLHPSVVNFAEVIVNFSSWFNQRYHTSVASAISIRDTLAWIEFVNKFKSDAPAQAILHGAAMVYIDTLGANPAAMLSISIPDIDNERRRCVEELGRLLGQDLTEEYFSTPELHASDGQLSLGKFILPRNPNASDNISFSFSAATTRKNAMRVFRALQLSKPLLIEGNPGVGKTTLVTAVAKAIGKHLVRINLSEQTDLMDLFGSDVPVEGNAVGVFAWRDAPFLSAMKNGDWVLLDEMNLASQSVLEGLNSCLDHRGEVFIAELGQSFPCHRDFRLFAAQNPHHQGGGRKGLPASFVNRFTVVYADIFKQDDLNLICKQLFPAADEKQISTLTRFVEKVETDVVLYHKFGDHGSPWEFNLRDTIRWLQLRTRKNTLLAAGRSYDFCDIIFRQRFRNNADREQLGAIFSDVFQEPPGGRSFYHNLGVDSYQVGLGLSHRNPILGGSLRTLPPASVSHLSTLEALMVCVECNWPVLLTGPQGSGKSSILKYLAAITGHRLITFSMNSGVDAMDLVGGYEQADPSRRRADLLDHVVACLRHLILTALIQEPSAAARLVQAIPVSIWTSTPSTEEIRGLIIELEAARASVFDDVLSYLRQLEIIPSQIEKAQFEWVDGLLVQALQRGDWLILENANLCSSSVLDRLNSLLEPNGYLSVNEHPTNNGEPRVIKPHIDFRIFLTMDPRHGELSRAMRNRSIEICLPAEESSQTASALPAFILESAMSRFRNIVAFDHDGIVEPAADHLSFEDFSLHQRFERQLSRGLIEGQQSQQYAIDTLCLTSKLNPQWISKAVVFQTIESLQVLADGTKQSIHPLNNEIVLRHRESSSISSHSIPFAQLFDVLYDVQKMNNAYDTAVAQANERQRPITLFDRSIRHKSLHGERMKDMIRVTSFLEQSLRILTNFIPSIVEREIIDKATLKTLSTLCRFWWELFHFATIEQVDSASYQVYIQLGFRTLDEIEKNDKLSTALVSAQRRILEALHAETGLATGLNMETLWRLFKPEVAPSLRHLKVTQDLIEVANRFDASVFPLRAPLKDLAITRENLQHALQQTISDCVSIDLLLTELASAIDGLGQSTKFSSSAAIFRTQFEVVYQILLGSRSCAAEHTMSRLGLLAGRSTAHECLSSISLTDLTSLRGSLARLSAYAHGTIIQQSPSAIMGGFAPSLTAALHEIWKVPLSDFEQLKIEMKFLAEVLSTHAFDMCVDQHQLVAKTFEKHLEAWRTQGLPDICHIFTQQDEPGGSQIGDGQKLGRDLVTYAVSCILEYVPDKPFDPALKESIRRQLLMTRKNALQNKISALREFEQRFSGQTQSLRITLAEQEMQEEGDIVPALRIVRPEISQLTELSGDFARVLEVARGVQMAASKGDAVEDSMLSNIVLLTQRLQKRYVAYLDIIEPVVQWLQCLWLGATLLNQSSHLLTDKAEQEVSPWKQIFRLATSSSRNEDGIAIKSLEMIRYFALARRVDSTHDITSLTWNFFDHLFLTWKNKMVEEMAKQEKKASLYVYKGSEADEDQIEAEEYMELFPDYELSSDQEREQSDALITEEIAVKVATIHSELCNPVFDAPNYLIQLVSQGVHVDANTHKNSIATSLPGIYLILEDAFKLFNSASANANAYNIYKDANVPEATKLATLVRKISRRFRELQAMEFEHTTVDDVVRLAAELLAFPHTQPIAKYLTKAEKLYEAMYEWEKVAHKGLSAAALLNEITDLLVSWRRLELSTWMQLFVAEQQKAENEAKSWWFVAYENIIANPKRLSREDVALHVPELLKVLEVFFDAATLGQFHQRLEILGNFNAHVKSLLTSYPELHHIYSGLSNFLAYYSRFKQPVADALATQRQQIEKQAKEVVQLASWRDTNIEALRQSAKASHRKLFNLVRKFRAIMNQPITSIIENGPPEELTSNGSLEVPSQNPLSNMSTIVSIIKICEESETWANVPPRFKNNTNTVQLMQQISVIPENLDAAHYIYEMINNVRETSSELREATPSVLTEENKDTIKHLKTSKRALFADVLKQMRKMGLQYNLSSASLTSQDSMARVFSSVPSMESQVCMQTANYHFHKVLSLMPKVRRIQHEHSDDLTPAEIQRSCGYLEGLLHQIIEQRQIISPLLTFIDDVDQLSTKIMSLWDDNESNVAHISRNTRKQTVEDFARRITWLEPVLHVICHVLNLQAQYGGLQCDHIYQTVSQIMEEVKQLKVDFNDAPNFPADIMLSKHSRLLQRAKDLMSVLRDHITMWSKQLPAFAPVLGILRPWVEVDDMSSIAAGIDERSYPLRLDSLQSAIIHTLDCMLASVQSLKGNWDQTPLPGEQASWLLQYQEKFASVFRSLCSNAIVENIRHCFDLLAAVSGSEQRAAVAMLILLQATVSQFCVILHNHSSQFISLNTALCKLAHQLSASFVEIGTKGFCSPSAKTDENAGTNDEQKLDGGTGLGDGEGAEDISKDVGDDEDLTELAQEPNLRKDGDEIEEEKDAVDMADEDMDGQVGETAENDDQEKEGGSDDEKHDDVEDEVGSVDDLGPEAVDEKMWDEGGATDDLRQKTTDRSKGTDNDEQVAANGDQTESREDQETEDDIESGAREDEAISHGNEEQLDNYTEQADKLDLPEDMNMDGSPENASDDESMEDPDSLKDDGQIENREDEQIENADVKDTEEHVQEYHEEGSEDPNLQELENETHDAEVSDEGEEEDLDHTDDLDENQQPDVDDILQGHDYNANIAKDIVSNDLQGIGMNEDEQYTQEDTFNSRSKQEEGQNGEKAEDSSGASGEQGSNMDSSKQDAVGRSDELVEASESHPFQKLGDTLEKWFNRQRQISQANDNKEARNREKVQDVDMADVDFEHLPNEEAEAEAQALGAASEDQAKALDMENAMAANDEEVDPKSFLQHDDEPNAHETHNDVPMEGNDGVEGAQLSEGIEQRQTRAFIGSPGTPKFQNDAEFEENSDIDFDDKDFNSAHSVECIRDGVEAVTISAANARALWTKYEFKTRTLAATLTEQLRLILAPTLATRLRGDFRTGKRLNIKRIIPYIASSYKRDKIWMRRSVPSKRAYQIMIAVDDSKSMAESGKKELAYETLALVTKALSMLEAGELCVVGFGEDVSVAHPFERPFSDDAGVEIFSALGFDQGDTDVRKLIANGIDIFQHARTRASSSAQDLWQLMIVVSDAICRDSESIRRLTRKAQEEKIMIVFVVVDSGAKEVDGRQVGSIMDLQGAEFKDGQVRMYKYMDVFPFRWWVVVRDVRELPGVLSLALKQWFAEVVDSGGY
ncbi:uncharacterized protein PV09_06212 [Verruconis gallopava]|uniref:Midasin n=1 Tax=Verruconis gallopava TaxID=253628 RepID=A0A0D1YNX1_9PEZI|nr:uncharacterized protein PV09_06212 [Verruconis gallopava]KIW02392.1 hypothetical protein PV09_06212 [Verruconis gallopava]